MTESANPPSSPPLPPPNVNSSGRIYGFWGTLLWGIAAYVALTAAQVAVMLAALSWWDFTQGGSLDVETVAAHGVMVSLAAFAAAPAVLAVLALAVRRVGADFSAYLALTPFSRHDLLVGLAAIALYIPFIAVLATWSGRPITPSIVVETYRTARESGALITLTLAVALVAPVTEEFAVRGFLFRGWAATRLGVPGTVLVTAALWALIHVQYEWFFVGEIFGAGLIFGLMRARSGSTWLTVALHGAYNLAALIEAAMLDPSG